MCDRFNLLMRKISPAARGGESPGTSTAMREVSSLCPVSSVSAPGMCLKDARELDGDLGSTAGAKCLWGRSEDVGVGVNLSQIRAGGQRAPCQVVSFGSQAH